MFVRAFSEAVCFCAFMVVSVSTAHIIINKKIK